MDELSVSRYVYTAVVSVDAGEMLSECTVTFCAEEVLDWEEVEARVREAAPEAVSIVRCEWMTDERR